jgi:hypothetical protein
MPYGILKADTITYYTATGDVSVAVSGIAIQGAPVISGVSGIFTASVSGATVTGNAGQFTTLTGGTAQFTSVTGVSGVFTTRISGATVTGDTGQFTTLTAVSGVFTTNISGATISGDAGLFGTISGGLGVFSNVLSVPSGTAGSPSVSFNGDPNTGLYSPGADQVAISTNGSASLTVGSAGAVTVNRGPLVLAGYSAEGGQLEISNPANNGTVYVLDATTATNARVFTVNNDTNLQIGQLGGTGGNVQFFTGASERMRLDSSGRLGLGTSAPPALFSAHSTDTSANFFIGEFQSTANPTGLSNTYVKFEKGDGFGGAVGGFIEQGVGSGLKLSALNGGTLTDVVTIRHTGNVGIGTSSVSEILHVSKNQDANTVIRLDNENTGTSASAALNLKSGAKDVAIKAFGAGSSFLIQGFNGIVTQYQDFDTHIWRSNAATERARIDSSGRLLIGTSSALEGSGLLHVKAGGDSAVCIQDDSFVGLLIRSYRDAGSEHAILNLFAARGTSSAPGILANGDNISTFNARGYDGSNFIPAARIDCYVDGTPGTNDMPGRLVFSVTADGAASPTEAMRIKSSRIVNIANTPVYTDNTAAKAGGLVNGDVYRKSDGTLMIVYT